MASSESNIASQNEIVFGENEMICSLTNKVVKATEYDDKCDLRKRNHESPKTLITMFGESRNVIYFTLINIKNNEKRKILPLSFLRD